MTEREQITLDELEKVIRIMNEGVNAKILLHGRITSENRMYGERCDVLESRILELFETYMQKARALAYKKCASWQKMMDRHSDIRRLWAVGDHKGNTEIQDMVSPLRADHIARRGEPPEGADIYVLDGAEQEPGQAAFAEGG